MEPGMHEDPESALRPLRNAAGMVAALRAGGLPPEEARTAVVQVAAAVEMTLRRLLRDLPQAALQVRLRALAPDELRSDEVLAELRQHDRISLQLAATVHDLFEVRQRLREGGLLETTDASLAYQVADRLEHEAVAQHTLPAPPPADGTTAVADETLLAPPPPSRRRRRSAVPTRWVWAAGSFLLLLALGIGIWWAAPRDEGQLEQGVALFRSGAFAEAASYFYRYAQAHPDDPTPHLYLARIHRRMRRPDLAGQSLRTALELAPQDADVHGELGFLLLDTGHPAEAVTRFRTALGLDPESETAWIGLVRALQAEGRPEAAERILARAPESIRQRFARSPESAGDTL